MAATVSNAGIGVFLSADDEIEGRVYLRSLRWVSKGAVAGDDLLVTESNGDIIMIGAADGANFTDVQIVERWVQGVKAAALDSGTLIAYFGEG